MSQKSSLIQQPNPGPKASMCCHRRDGRYFVTKTYCTIPLDGAPAIRHDGFTYNQAPRDCGQGGRRGTGALGWEARHETCASVFAYAAPIEGRCDDDERRHCRGRDNFS